MAEIFVVAHVSVCDRFDTDGLVDFAPTLHAFGSEDEARDFVVRTHDEIVEEQELDFVWNTDLGLGEFWRRSHTGDDSTTFVLPGSGLFEIRRILTQGG